MTYIKIVWCIEIQKKNIIFDISKYIKISDCHCMLAIHVQNKPGIFHSRAPDGSKNEAKQGTWLSRSFLLFCFVFLSLFFWRAEVTTTTCQTRKINHGPWLSHNFFRLRPYVSLHSKFVFLCSTRSYKTCYLLISEWTFCFAPDISVMPHHHEVLVSFFLLKRPEELVLIF